MEHLNSFSSCLTGSYRDYIIGGLTEVGLVTPASHHRCENPAISENSWCISESTMCLISDDYFIFSKLHYYTMITWISCE